MARKKKEPKNKSVERKVYYYKVTCKCDGKDEFISHLFDAYINRSTFLPKVAGLERQILPMTLC